ncbi:hypothetical protein MRB53_038789 [Persea americana]|nr:hypothetical protein MRB53_038789 [Persea americana]
MTLKRVEGPPPTPKPFVPPEIPLEPMLRDEKYPAKEHFAKVLAYLKEHDPTFDANGVLYLEAQKLRMNEDNDQEAPFRQRRHFFYLTGCEAPDCYIVYDLKTMKSTLFIPPIVDDDVIWSGLPLLKEEALQKYDVDDVQTTTSLLTFLTTLSSRTIYAIQHQISQPFHHSTLQTTTLKTAIDESRVVKTSYELALLRHANAVTRHAHYAVMRSVSTAPHEMLLEGNFLQACMAHRCRHQAYSPIVATGTDASTLHYVHNDKRIEKGKTLNLLLDAGAEWRCYAADVTRTFPVSGKWTKESRAVYEIVLRQQTECMEMLKEGVVWDELHAHAHRVAIDGLLKLGVLKGDAKEIFDARASVPFFPHGLGHYLGLDTHDTGGHANYDDPDPMYRYLRVRGKLPAGCVITVEPGVYFSQFQLEPALKDPKIAKFIDRDVLERYWSVGGVRIEDDVLVLKNGFENLTKIPRGVQDMEDIVNGADI